MKLPGQLEAEIAIKTVWLVVAGLAFAALVGALVVQTVRLEGLKVWPITVTGWIETADTYERERDAERNVHAKTKGEYRAAQSKAARQEAARLKHVREKQEEITDAIETDYRGQLADLRARAERLRSQLQSRTDIVSKAAGKRSAEVRDTTGRTGAPAADHRLPAAGEERATGGVFGRTPEEQLERDIVATQQALQLDALIDWVERQAAIDPNAAAD